MMTILLGYLDFCKLHAYNLVSKSTHACLACVVPRLHYLIAIRSTQPLLARERNLTAAGDYSVRSVLPAIILYCLITCVVTS